MALAAVQKPAGKIADGISCHAWNADFTQIALSPCSNQVLIYKVVGQDASKWQLVQVLEEHDSYVSAIDWSPVTNMIVTCSHDRNAYVWKLDPADNKWKPTLVVLRINRAATCVKWSPNGKKFAVGSGAKHVPVCHFEAGENWWIAKILKKHHSTVTCIDWHPNNKFLVTGSCDRRVRVFSAYLEEVDTKEDEVVFQEIWPDQFKFGTVLAEFQCNAWINSVSFAPSGFRIAYAVHDSTVNFVQILAGSQPLVQTERVDGLPFLTCNFIGDNSVVCAGYDNNPIVYVAEGDEGAPKWKQAAGLDDHKEAAAKPEQKTTATANAFKKFQDQDSRGLAATGDSALPPTKLQTRHQNTILSLVPMWKKGSTTCTEFTTSGPDGLLLFWDLKKQDLKKLGLA